MLHLMYITLITDQQFIVAVAESLQVFKSKRTSQQTYSSHSYVIISSVALLKA